MCTTLLCIRSKIKEGSGVPRCVGGIFSHTLGVTPYFEFETEKEPAMTKLCVSDKELSSTTTTQQEAG